MRVIAQLIDDLPQVHSANEVIEAVMDLSIMWGVTGVLMTRVPVLGDRLGDHVISSTWSKSWIDHYTEKCYLKLDPIARRLFATRKPFMWSEYCSNHNLSDIEQLIMREAGDAGLVDGFTIPVHGFNSTVCISFSTDGRYIAPVRREVLRVVGIVALERIDEIGGVENRDKGKIYHEILAPREIECLYHAWMGSNSKEIARFLGISFRTVDKYILNAIRKLSARNRADAIRVALEGGFFPK